MSEVTPMSFGSGSPAGSRSAVFGMDHTRTGVANAYNATQGLKAREGEI